MFEGKEEGIKKKGWKRKGKKKKKLFQPDTNQKPNLQENSTSIQVMFLTLLKYWQPLHLFKHESKKPVNAWPSLTCHFRIFKKGKIAIQKHVNIF